MKVSERDNRELEANHEHALQRKYQLCRKVFPSRSRSRKPAVRSDGWHQRKQSRGRVQLGSRHRAASSENNREEGFVPAFLDTATGHVYRSCFANGTPAPIHLLDGLPGDLVIARDADRRAIAFKPTLVAGFLRADRFYTREQAAHCVSTYH